MAHQETSALIKVLEKKGLLQMINDLIDTKLETTNRKWTSYGLK